ncbi:MAG: YfhO family protein [Bacteroidetes bacterium]|nr:YfhO family protein [Bacteroidota bacterium]
MLLLALVIAVFSMVTCGFPTTSAFFGLIVILVYIPYIISLCINKEIHFQSLCCDLIAAHIIGFGLASYQIMSIYELFEINNTPRTGFGLIQFPLENIFSFFSINVSNITSAKPEIFYRSQTSLGLLPTTLFFIGIYAVIRHIKRISYADIGALACMIFFMLKLFPLWPGFNTFIGSIPMLAESKFRSYFFFCFLWGLAYFVAKGVTYIIEQQKISQTIITTVVFTSGLATLALLAHSLSLLNISISSFFESNMYEKGYKILWAFGSGFFFLLIGTSYKNKNRFIASACLIVILLLSIYEQLLTLPAGFNAWGSTAMTTKRVAGYLQDYSISKFDFRERSHGGNLVSAGIATINNGAPTLVPPRTMLYRNTLFNSSWKGMLPISGTKTAHSWQISSAALYPTDFFQIADYSNLPQWDRLQKVEGGKIKIESIVILSETLTKPYTLLKTNSLGTTKIQGWAVDPKVDTLEGSSVYVVLSGEHGEIVAPVKVKRRRSVVKYFKNPGYKKAGWEVHFDGNVLRAGTYSIFIRYLRPDHSTYYEKDSGKTFTVVKDGLTSETQNTPSPQLRYLGKDGKRYLYKDESVLPRAYTVARCFPVDNMGEAAKKLQNDLKFRIGDAYIENLSEDEKKFCTDNQNKLNHIPILEDKGSSVRLGPIEGPTILMLSDNIYPGWSAYDIENKQKYEVKPANIAFRAVLLPENRMYSIRFLYRPPWLTIARAAVLFSCILLSSLAFLAWRPRR